MTDSWLIKTNTMKPKSIFKSKTAFASMLTVIAGAMGNIYPGIHDLLSNHASSILLAVGALNMGLRFVTKGRVVLLAE